MFNLDEYARDLVAGQPHPPRRVPLFRLVLRTYLTRAGLAVSGFALAVGVPLTIVSAFTSGPVWARLLLLGAASLITLLFAVSPLVGAVRLQSALRHGIRVDGEILDVRWFAPSLRPPTIDAGTYGMARGTRRVHHPAGSFDERFESDAPWASDLTDGGAIALLVHPQRRTTLRDLGPRPPPRRAASTHFSAPAAAPHV